MPSEAPLEKLPPQNIEAEMAVLGSMLIDEDAVAQAIEILSADYFYRESHRHIYSCILNLYNVNKAVDLITICDELKKQNLLEKAEGPSYLASLVNLVPSSANVRHYANIVRGEGGLTGID